MEGRKWEEMNVDCLANIFGRVGIESLLLDIPYVCKTWYKATLNPLCWQHILFPHISLHDWSQHIFHVDGICDCSKSRLEEEYDLGNESSITSFIKSVVKRSDGLVTDLALPGCCTKEALLYVADACPELSLLELPCNLLRNHLQIILELISKWKNLEFLRLGDISYIREILGEVVKHCKNFTGLAVTVDHIDETYIGEAETSALVMVPKIKHLDLRCSMIEKDNLIRILKGCSELEHLDVRYCRGFHKDDEEIIMLGSHIRKFMREGSIPYLLYLNYFQLFRLI